MQERIPEDLDLSATKDKTGEAHHVRGWRRLDSDLEKLKYDPRNSYARRDIGACTYRRSFAAAARFRGRLTLGGGRQCAQRRAKSYWRTTVSTT